MLWVEIVIYDGVWSLSDVEKSGVESGVLVSLMDKASDALDVWLFLNGRATPVATFLTRVTIFLADLAVDEATDNRDGDEQDETPRGAMLNADLKKLPVFRVSFIR